MTPLNYTRAQALPEILKNRIAILDGAMGTMIQRFKLSEADYRGERFKDFPKDVKGNNELLSLTRPDVIRDIHEGYLAAGADLIETNTFGATTIAQEDYDMAHLAREMNLASARIAREACDKFSTPDKPRFVAGALGPTPKTASISPDVNDPGARNVDFDTLRQEGGLSGYPSREESEHDIVESSHASSSLSWADGISRGYAMTGQHDRHLFTP